MSLEDKNTDRSNHGLQRGDVRATRDLLLLRLMSGAFAV
jgi:hypothetical protein